MFKKFTVTIAAVAGLMMIGSPAFADDPGFDSFDDPGPLLTVCHNSVNVLRVHVVDVLDGLSANVPILTSETATDSEGDNQDPCVPAVASEDDH